jgi:hypothetical protein
MGFGGAVFLDVVASFSLPGVNNETIWEASLTLHGRAATSNLYVPLPVSAFASIPRSALAVMFAVDVTVDAAAAALDALVVVGVALAETLAVNKICARSPCPLMLKLLWVLKPMRPLVPCCGSILVSI